MAYIKFRSDYLINEEIFTEFALFINLDMCGRFCQSELPFFLNGRYNLIFPVYSTTGIIKESFLISIIYEVIICGWGYQSPRHQINYGRLDHSDIWSPRDIVML